MNGIARSINIYIKENEFINHMIEELLLSTEVWLAILLCNHYFLVMFKLKPLALAITKYLII